MRVLSDLCCGGKSSSLCINAHQKEANTLLCAYISSPIKSKWSCLLCLPTIGVLCRLITEEEEEEEEEESNES